MKIIAELLCCFGIVCCFMDLSGVLVVSWGSMGDLWSLRFAVAVFCPGSFCSFFAGVFVVFFW